MRLKNLYAFVVLLPTLAFAADNSDLMRCAVEDNSLRRLACFDAVVADRGLAPTNTATTGDEMGKWTTRTRTNPLTDKAIHVALLEADSGRGRFGDKVGLVVRCEDNKTDMYINWGSFLGSDRISTTYRVGREDAQTSSWPISTDHKAAFFPGSPVGVLRRIAAGEGFVASVTPYSESPVTSVFDTSGAAAAFADIREACNW